MSAKPPHLLLVEALFYEHIAADLRRGAERVVAEAGATCEVISVPGSFEVRCFAFNNTAARRSCRNRPSETGS